MKIPQKPDRPGQVHYTPTSTQGALDADPNSAQIPEAGLANDNKLTHPTLKLEQEGESL